MNNVFLLLLLLSLLSHPVFAFRQQTMQRFYDQGFNDGQSKANNVPTIDQNEWESRVNENRNNAPPICLTNTMQPRGTASGTIRIYSQADCNAMNGILYPNGECLKSPLNTGSWSYDCRVLNFQPLARVGQAPCYQFGKTSADIRVYTTNECLNMNGLPSIKDGQDYGECLKQGGGSYSWDCRNV